MGKPFQKDIVSNVARTAEFAGEAVKKTGKNFLVNLFKNNKPAAYTIVSVALGGTVAFFLGKYLGKKKGKKEIEAASAKNEANADCKE